MAAVPKRKVQRKNQGATTFTKSVVLTSSGVQSTSTDNHLHFVMPEAGVYLGAVVNVGTAPTGQSLIVDVNKNGTTLYTTQGRRPTVAAAATTSTSSGVPDGATTLASGDVIKVDIDQVGSGTAGSDLSVTVTYLANAV